MEDRSIVSIEAVIDHIERHLDGKLELETIAEAVHYSKYHLHRLFTKTVGITIHDYVQRRQLTEAAKLLVFSDKPVIEIALLCGYESQQSFSSAFKAMYKSPPRSVSGKRQLLSPAAALYAASGNKRQGIYGAGYPLGRSSRSIRLDGAHAACH